MSDETDATDSKIYLEALKSEVRKALANKKAFACPIAMRQAWHSAGTYDKTDGTGGSDGATMRFEPEISDEANKGLIIIRDMLQKVKDRFPEISEADLWTFAGTVAIEFMGGPEVDHEFGRTDAEDGSACPETGRLPDADKGAEHLREVFYRMGFDDQEIVALSGGHTVGRAHKVRSGYDGPWTHNNLEFDNSYFENLVELEWKERDWDGEFQYTDVETETLCMLPTDMALIEDDDFRPWVERYAEDEEKFFDDFADAYAKLMALGCPDECDPFSDEENDEVQAAETVEDPSAGFREFAMHGSLEYMKRLVDEADVHEVEEHSGRSALHKAAYWGHEHVVCYLVHECGLDVDLQDFEGDTALHDAARFGHANVAEILLDAGADPTVENDDGLTVGQIAEDYDKPDIAAMVTGRDPAMAE